MTDQFTTADVQLVAEAMWQKLKDTDFPNLSGPPTAACFEDARAILSALAEAGRLVPDGAEVREEWGVRLIWDDPAREPSEFESQSRRDAEHRYATHVEARRQNPRWYVTPRLIRRTKITHVGPWVEADEDSTR